MMTCEEIKQHPLISVIVPVYMVEQYLRLCIESILNQTYKNLEVFLIDDGSKDSCGDICDEYGELDERVHVIHKQNGGLSDARNVALDQISGEYVSFVDSDDYISSTFFEELLNCCIENNAEISVCDEDTFKYCDGKICSCGSRYKKHKSFKVMTGIDALDICLRQELFDVSAWGKLYKTYLFEGVRYPYKRLHEDIPTTYKLFLESKKVVYIGNGLYHYCVRDTSIMGQKQNPQRFIDLMDGADSQEREICRICPSLELQVKCRTIASYFQALEGAFLCNNNELIERAWNRILQLRFDVLKCRNARYKVKIAVLLSYFGKGIFYRIQKALKR